MKKIYDFSLGFSILKKWIISLFFIFYKKVTVLGSDNIPEEEGPYIFAPVHQNALMDALAVHSIYPKPIVFMMRGDAFSHRFLTRFFYYIKILPIFRRRDGRSLLSKDTILFNRAVEVLCSEKALGIMPEGDQKEKRRLRALGKGIFRIALQAQKNLGTKNLVQIIPIGLDYENYDFSGSNLIITVGSPVSFPVDSIYTEDEVVLYSAMRKRLSAELKKLIVHIEDEKNHDLYYLATLLLVEDMRKNRKIRNDDESFFYAKQQVAAMFPASGEPLPPNLERWVQLSKCYLKYEKNPDEAFFLSKQIQWWRVPLVVVYMAILIFSFLLNGLPYLLIKWYSVKKLKSVGFSSSGKFIAGIVLYPLYWFLLIVIVGFWIHSFVKSFFLFGMIAPFFAILSIRVKSICFDSLKKLRRLLNKVD